MVSSNNIEENVNFEEFCSLLHQLDLEVCQKNGVVLEETIDSVPYASKVRFLLRIMSSSKDYFLKTKALSRVKLMYSNWLTESDIPDQIISDSKNFFFLLLTLEVNESFLDELLSTLACLVKAINKDKSNKFEILIEIVTKCGLSENKLLKNKILTFLIDNFDLFGENREIRLSQFGQFVKSCLEMPNNPTVVLLAVNALGVVVKHDSPNVFKEGFSELVPSLLITMKKFMLSPNAFEFIKGLQVILESYPIMFQNYIRKILKHVVTLLKNKEINLNIKLEILYWLDIFISKYGEDVEKNHRRYVSVLIDLIVDLQVDLYSVNQVSTQDSTIFEANIVSNDIYDPYTCLINISESFRNDIMYKLLLSKVHSLLRRSDWKRITVAYDVLRATLKCCGRRMMPNPWKAYRMFKKRVSHKNSTVFLSSIKCVSVLCETFQAVQFNTLYGDVLSLILRNVNKHPACSIKNEAAKVMANITKIWEIKPVIATPKNLKNRFLEVALALSEGLANEGYVVALANLVHKNTYYVKVLLFDLATLLGSDFLQYLIMLLNQIVFLPGLHYTVRSVLQCIESVAEYSAFHGPENFVSLITRYVDKFKTWNNLSEEYLPIPSFFFPLLCCLAKRKSTYIRILISKIGCSIEKVILEIKSSSNEQIIEDETNKITDQNGFQNQSLIYRDVNGEFDALVDLTVVMVENYGADFSSYVSSYLFNLFELLSTVRKQTFVIKLITGTGRIVKSGILFGDTDNVKKFWNEHFKNKLLQMFDQSDGYELLSIIKLFKELLVMKKFDDAFNSMDIIEIIDKLEQVVFSTANVDGKTTEELKIALMLLSYSQSCIHLMLQIYKLEVVFPLIPLCKRVLGDEPSSFSSVFIKFMLDLFDAIIDYVDQSSVPFIDLVPKIIDFCYVIFERRDYAISVVAGRALLNIRKHFQMEFDNYFGFGNDILKLIIEFSTGLKLNSRLTN